MVQPAGMAVTGVSSPAEAVSVHLPLQLCAMEWVLHSEPGEDECDGEVLCHSFKTWVLVAAFITSTFAKHLISYILWEDWWVLSGGRATERGTQQVEVRTRLSLTAHAEACPLATYGISMGLSFSLHPCFSRSFCVMDILGFVKYEVAAGSGHSIFWDLVRGPNWAVEV